MNPIRPPRIKPRLNRTVIILSILLIIALFSIEIYMNTTHHSNERINQFQDLFPKDIAKGVMYITYILNHEFTMFFFIILVFNLCNIYKAFILMTSISLTYYLSGLTKMLYLAKKPYFFNSSDTPNNDIRIYFCELGWGYLCSNILTMVLFYFSLWKVFVESKSSLPQWMKYCSLGFVIVSTGCFSFCFLLNGTNYLLQIASSYLIGVGIYILIFEGMNIDLNDGNEFYTYFIQRPLLFYVLIYSGLCSIYLFPYFFRMYPGEDPIKQCEGTIHSFANQKKEDDDDIIQQYQNENIVYLGYFISSFFSIFAIKCELFFSFKRDISNWLQFNFTNQIDINEVDEFESIFTSITITQDTKWNRTTSIKSFIRFIVLLIMSVITIIPYIVLYDQWEKNIYLIFFFKMLCSSSLFLFCLFYLSKVVLIKLNLVNTTLMIIQASN